MFGSGKLFKRRWAILQGQVLTIYDDIDLKNQKPKGLVKAHIKLVDMAARKRTKNILDGDQKYCFEILPLDKLNDVNNNIDTDPDVKVYASDSAELGEAWIEALNEASNGDALVLTYPQHCNVLGLKFDGKNFPTETEITHAYQTLAQENHPDVDGNDPRVFDRITRAYQAIMRDYDRNLHCNIIEYNAVIIKTKQHGLGLVIEEESTGLGEKLITYVDDDNIDYHDIDANSGGHVNTNDIVVSVGGDNIELWKHRRVTERLSDFREPPGGGNYIMLRLMRYIDKPIVDENNTTGSGKVNFGAEMGASTNPHPQGDDTASPPKSILKKGVMQPSPGAAGSGSSNANANVNANVNANANANAHTHSGGQQERGGSHLGHILGHSPTPPNISIAPGQLHSHGHGALFDNSLSPIAAIVPSSGSKNQSQSSSNSAAVLVPLQKENAQQKVTIHNLEKDLLNEKQKNLKLIDALKTLAVDMKDKTNKLILSQQQENYYRIQLEELIINSLNLNTSNSALNKNALDDLTNEVNKNVAGTSSSLLQGRTIYPTELTEKYLKSVNLSINDMNDKGLDTYQNAQRIAMCAVSSIDPSASMLKMWDAGGNSAVDKLTKLEKRLQKMEQSMGYKSVSSGFQLKSNGSNSISTSNGNGNGNGNTDGTSNTSSSLFGSESKSGSNRPKSSTMGFVSHGGK